MKDNLTRRERLVYKVLHGLGIAVAVVGLFWFVVLDRHEPTYIVAVVFSLACLLAPVFGYALRSDTRVLHGLPWFRRE
jgi:multidrug efflux pump subunit AcrB